MLVEKEKTWDRHCRAPQQKVPDFTSQPKTYSWAFQLGDYSFFSESICPYSSELESHSMENASPEMENCCQGQEIKGEYGNLARSLENG